MMNETDSSHEQRYFRFYSLVNVKEDLFCIRGKIDFHGGKPGVFSLPSESAR